MEGEAAARGDRDPGTGRGSGVRGPREGGGMWVMLCVAMLTGSAGGGKVVQLAAELGSEAACGTALGQTIAQMSGHRHEVPVAVCVPK